MLLPIELFHVCVSGSTSTSRTSDGTGRSGRSRDVPDARVVPRRVPAPRAGSLARPAARRRVASGSALWVRWGGSHSARLAGSASNVARGPGGYIGYLKDPRIATL